MLHHRHTDFITAQDSDAVLIRFAARTACLSPKERDVVYGLASGRAPKQLAADGQVSLATIRAHIQSAKRKTRARTLTELVAVATRVRSQASR